MERAKEPAVSTADILRDFLTQKMTRNNSFSLRAFARDLGISHTYLSLVLNGKKQLSLRKAIQFTELLKMDRKTAEAFLATVSQETNTRLLEKVQSTQTADHGLPKRVRKPKGVEYFELELDRFRLLSEWYHLPLLDLTLTRDFISDPKWIARKLGISIHQATDAIERLKRLGMLHIKDGKLLKTKSHLVVQPKQPDKIIRAYHRKMIEKALHELESGDPEDVASRDITGVTIPINPARIPEARLKIMQFRRSLWKFLSDGECTDLYQLNIQMFPLTVREKAVTPGKLNGGEVLKRGSK